MKSKMQYFGSLWLLFVCMHLADPQELLFSSSFADSVAMDMAKNSIDDRYSTCARKMEEKVQSIFFQKEMENEPFKTVWQYCVKKIENTENGGEGLTNYHREAICAYTAGQPENLYLTFNNKVRTMRDAYGSSFPFHSLHFWLTTAVQILKKSDKNRCYTTFRRTDAIFTGDLKQEIRLGQFVSTSFESNLAHFGTRTCFNITTCYGADLKSYSEFEDEKEVLIPPYEKFKIIGKTTKIPDCEIVYVLKSTGVQSNLNCKLANKCHGDYFLPTLIYAIVTFHLLLNL
ncbi:erythroblast NAD(P)(+)--arginine ADP-ribosyltransferase-like [Cyprinodon tularosa]|uniref:erythroblast NAD(P)(+)--arginine ADP-ribosyltransferase-like n=1 Tax=Cyprinodon tularosa TaxID=77115 RepID=UPI0018E235D9|nr:erythroblast NAD(P)(+)--arginine ADP-ribosyltransferase-like [Cyprinodon tularosa]